MKLKELTHPRHVYEGAFEMYFIRPFAHHYADFKGREPVKGALRSLLAWVVVSLGVAGVLMGLVGLLGPEVGFSALWTIGILWIAASLCPLVALMVRGSHGATNEGGEGAVSAEPRHRPRLLGIDILLGASCAVFFLLGLLMLVTTMNSGRLNPNATMTDETVQPQIEGEHVTEEPIFTYQDEASAVEESQDTLTDMDESDLAAPEESYDPTIGSLPREYMEENPSDSL